jgi:hypothetical protein
MRRLSWFFAGAAAGAAGAAAAKRKVRRTAARWAPTAVAKDAVASTRARGQRVVDALREGKVVMAAKELELRALRDGHPVRPQAAGPSIDATEVHDLESWRRRSHERRRARP